MIVKVCGLREPDNIRDVAAAGADWIGLIFYPQSPRYVGEGEKTLRQPIRIHGQIVRKVGVFVDASFEEMRNVATEYSLDFLQLHGNESPDLCYALRKRGLAVIKALPIATASDMIKAVDYTRWVDYLLFDTKCESYGGSGQLFDWSVLSTYRGETPFLLSGGLRPESLKAVKTFSHPCLAGIDLNSGFETAPARKNAPLLAEFIENIKMKQK